MKPLRAAPNRAPIARGCALFAPLVGPAGDRAAPDWLPKHPLTWAFFLWGRLDSNQRPTDYESAALTN